jgi:hypothetical protein
VESTLEQETEAALREAACDGLVERPAVREFALP